MIKVKKFKKKTIIKNKKFRKLKKVIKHYFLNNKIIYV